MAGLFISEKRCSRCATMKSVMDFNRCNREADGLQTYCKACRKEIAKLYRQTARGKETTRKAHQRFLAGPKGKDYYRRYQQTEAWKETKKRYRQSDKGKEADKRCKEKNRGKFQARTDVNNAIKLGKLPRPDTLKCSCGQDAKEYHHHLGYEPEHRLHVIPLCKSCHIKADAAQSQSKPY